MAGLTPAWRTMTTAAALHSTTGTTQVVDQEEPVCIELHCKLPHPQATALGYSDRCQSFGSHLFEGFQSFFTQTGISLSFLLLPLQQGLTHYSCKTLPCSSTLSLLFAVITGSLISIHENIVQDVGESWSLNFPCPRASDVVR